VTTEHRDPFAVPDRLGEIGAALWLRSVRRAPWITELDLFLLEDLCHTAEHIEAMRDAIATDGIFLTEPYVDEAGNVTYEHRVPHPGIEVLRDAREVFTTTATALGLTPDGRAQLGWPDESDPDAG